MSLSDKIETKVISIDDGFIHTKDVKEFIKKLKKEMAILFNDSKMGYKNLNQEDFDLLFLKLAGEKLCP